MLLRKPKRESEPCKARNPGYGKRAMNDKKTNMNKRAGLINKNTINKRVMENKETNRLKRANLLKKTTIEKRATLLKKTKMKKRLFLMNKVTKNRGNTG